MPYYVTKKQKDKNGVEREVQVERFNDREKLEYHKEQAKKGSVDSTGKPLSDFARGQHSAKVAQLGRKLGNYKLRKAVQENNVELVNEIQSDRKQRAEERRRQHAEYKERRKAEKQAKKQIKK